MMPMAIIQIIILKGTSIILVSNRSKVPIGYLGKLDFTYVKVSIQESSLFRNLLQNIIY